MDKVDRQTIHDEIMSYLKITPDTQFANIVGHLERKLRINVQHYIKIIMEEIHLLLLNNILMIGHNVGQWEYPWLCVTDYGKECLKEGISVSLDPEGYIAIIKQELPEIDSVILDYLMESIAAFHRNLILSSTITLGVASEQAMLILIESFAPFSSGFPQLNKVKDKLENEDSIFKKYKIFKESVSQLPKETREYFPQNYDIHIDTLFNFIRLNRNETGHPLGGGRDRNIQAANLQAFNSYLADIYNLIGFFKKSH